MWKRDKEEDTIRVTISGPQLAEAIQAAAWVVDAPEIQQAIDRLGAVLECTACQAERTAGLLRVCDAHMAALVAIQQWNGATYERAYELSEKKLEELL